MSNNTIKEMNNTQSHTATKTTLLAELDKLYTLWKEERISKRSFLSEEELRTIYKKAHSFFILDT